jgi:putative flavoprotein involved in K+ transport
MAAPSDNSAGLVLSGLVDKTLFVLGLADEKSVREFCGEFGAVLAVTMVQKPPPAQHRSWAFVTFLSTEAADAAFDAAQGGKGAAAGGATVRIKGAAEVGEGKFRELAAHTARASALVSTGQPIDPTGALSEEETFEDADAGTEETERQAKKRKREDDSSAEAECTQYDLLIVGAGASGVGCGAMAKRFGIDPARTLIVERGSAVGSTFDQWPAEMRFITPSFNQQAFGMMDLNSVAFNTSPAQMCHQEHPTGQQYAEYLRDVAEKFKLPVALDTDVTAVSPITVAGEDSTVFEVSVAQAAGAARKLPPAVRAKFVIWAAGEFQYPRNDGFPGAAANCVHNSRVKSWEGLSDSNDEMVVIGGYESGMDATVHLSNAGVDVTVLASTPFWSMRTLDPSTELAPFTADRLRAAMQGSHPPTLVSRCRVVSVEKDEQEGGYIVTAVKAGDAESSTAPATGSYDKGAWDYIKRREPATAPGQDSRRTANTVRVRTSAKPVLATGFSSGVGQVVNHLFDWTEDSACASAAAAGEAAGPSEQQQRRRRPEPIFCDRSQVRLTRESGWWHLMNGEYDLCSAEYQKLSDEEKAKYVEIKDIDDDVEDEEGVDGDDDFGVFCDRTKGKLTVDSGWWHKVGEQYDLCTGELEKLPAVSRAFPSCTRSILTEIYLCHACSCHEIEDGNAWTG